MPRSLRRRKPVGLRGVVRVLGILALLVVAGHYVLPKTDGMARVLDLLLTADVSWVVAGAALEAASLAAYSFLTRSVLPTGQLAYSMVLRTDLTALGVSHVLPGGGAVSTTLRYRLLRGAGVSAEAAGVGVAFQGVMSLLVLGTILWLSSTISFVAGTRSPYLLVVIGVGAVVIAAAVIVGGLIDGRSMPVGRDRILRLVPRRFRSGADQLLSRSLDRLRLMIAERRTLGRVVLWACVNWLLDVASLWVFLGVYGHHTDVIGLLIAHGLANIIGALPITPGGLGVIETVLIPTLMAFGTPASVAVVGVLSWRVFQFWAPIPVAGVTYLLLRGHLSKAHP